MQTGPSPFTQSLATLWITLPRGLQCSFFLLQYLLSGLAHSLPCPTSGSCAALRWRWCSRSSSGRSPSRYSCRTGGTSSGSGRWAWCSICPPSSSLHCTSHLYGIQIRAVIFLPIFSKMVNLPQKLVNNQLTFLNIIQPYLSHKHKWFR